MSYESTKIRDVDYAEAHKIKSETGLTIIDSVGAAIAGFAFVPKTVRERIVRERRALVAKLDRRQTKISA